MKKITIISTAVCCLASANAFSMDIQPYVEARISNNFQKALTKELIDYDSQDQNSFNDTFIFGGAIAGGIRIDNFRVEIEQSLNDTSKDTYVDSEDFKLLSKVNTISTFLNTYYDFDLPFVNKFVKPYINAGVGYSWIKQSFSENDFIEMMTFIDQDISWNVGAGLDFAVNDNVNLSLGYRYEILGTLDKTVNFLSELLVNTKVTNHKVSLGLRYTF